MRHNIVLLKNAFKSDMQMILKNIWLNIFDHHIILKRDSACIHLCNGADVQIDKTARIVSSASLYVSQRNGKRNLLNTRIWVQNGGEIDVTGDFIVFEGASIHIHKNSKLLLHGGFINNHARIVCEGCIEIGEDVAIAPGVVIRSCDSHHIESQTSVKDIHIGNHVRIGENAIILKGVTIGDGAVIGAGSIVTKEVPALSVVAGNPARVIKENIQWEK